MNETNDNLENQEGDVSRTPEGSVRALDSRELESRENTARKRPAYEPQNLLKGVPEKEGFVRKWLTAEIMGEKVQTGLKFRDGWVPVRASDYPNQDYPTMEFGNFGDVITISGMILCEMDIERSEDINDYHLEKARNAESLIKQKMRSEVEGLQDDSGPAQVSVGGQTRMVNTQALV